MACMEIMEAGPHIVKKYDTGFNVNMNNMEPGRYYYFEFLDTEYAIKTDGDGSLTIGEIPH